MNLKEFLLTQAKKAGIADDPEFSLLISASVLNELEVPETVVSKFNSNLFDSELAKTNLDLKNHFIRNYMMGYDEEIIKMAKDYGLPMEVVDELKTTKNSGDKVKLAFKHLKDLEEQAKKSSSKGQSEEYLKKISEAQTKLDETIARTEAEKKSIEHKFVSKMQGLWEQAQLSGIQWNDAIPEAARVPAYKSVLDAKLQSLGGKVVFDAENNSARLVNMQDETLPLVVSGKEFGYKDLSALVLQENKLLKEAGNGGSNPNFSGTQSFIGSPQTTSTPLPSYITGALADIGKTAAKSITNFSQ